jgi:hypothetical protein
MFSACSSADSTTPLSSSLSDAAATETAIADSVAGLFGATREAATVPLPISTFEPLQQPELVAQMWLSAIMTGDGLTVGRLTCRAYQEDGSTISGMMGMLPNILAAMSDNLAAGSTVQLDLSRARFEVLTYGQETVVALSGTIGIALGGFYRENTLTGAENPIRMVYEDGIWKTCGFWMS